MNLSDSSSDEEESKLQQNFPPKKRKIHYTSEYDENAKKSRLSNDAAQESMEQIQKKGGYSNAASKMMSKMGYRAGKGLGKEGQGMVDIVPASNQRGRRGLGLVLPSLEVDITVDWTDEKEPTEIETYQWMKPLEENLVPDDDWFDIGKRKNEIINENDFCSKELMAQLIKCKNVFDDLEGPEMRNARARSNPYESIRGGIFLNRAAMKMANLDNMFQFMFTSPKDLSDDGILYFADVCAGPGGFSEYVLWRRGWRAKGFGFTLKGQNDFKLHEFHSTHSEQFEPHYGVGGLDGTGDITVSANIHAFRTFVMDSTDDEGVYFVTADGGFSVEGQENIQEILSKQLLLCQFATALSILRPGGSFLCKTFDLFTSFSAGCIYLLRQAFEQVTIVKPVTSRPANSERYVVCTGFKDEDHSIFTYMMKINDEMNKLKGKDQDVNDVIPTEILMEDDDFVQYLTESNKEIALEQCKALSKIHAFVKDRNLKETRQRDMRERCLRLWRIPDEMRREPAKKSPVQLFNDLSRSQLNVHALIKWNQLYKQGINDIAGIKGYRCYVSGNNRTTFLLSKGKRQIFFWDAKYNNWQNQSDLHVKCELPRDTLLEVEVVRELKDQGNRQHREQAVHVVDAVVLGGDDISNKMYDERMRLTDMFLKVCHRPTRKGLSTIRVKELFLCEHLSHMFDKIQLKQVKGQKLNERRPLLPCINMKDSKFFHVAESLRFVRLLKEPWTMAWSKSGSKIYYYDTKDKTSTYDLEPEKMIANYAYSSKTRLYWKWTADVKVHDDQELDSQRIPEHLVSKDFILQHFGCAK